jgi:hypothetical protein
VQHGFWQTRLPLLDLPPEPALEAFIQLHGLAPSREDKAAASQVCLWDTQQLCLTDVVRMR